MAFLLLPEVARSSGPQVPSGEFAPLRAVALPAVGSCAGAAAAAETRGIPLEAGRAGGFGCVIGVDRSMHELANGPVKVWGERLWLLVQGGHARHLQHVHVSLHACNCAPASCARSALTRRAARA